MLKDPVTPRILVTTGPESCGKTSLALELGARLQCPVIPEVARDYLQQKLLQDPAFSYRAEDLLEIARQHLECEATLLARRPERLVLDTDLRVILVWHQVRFGEGNKELERMFARSLQAAPRLFLLCSPDLPWEPDPLRENPADRRELFKLYRQQLDQLALPYHVIEGFGAARVERTLKLIKTD